MEPWIYVGCICAEERRQDKREEACTVYLYAWSDPENYKKKKVKLAACLKVTHWTQQPPARMPHSAILSQSVYSCYGHCIYYSPAIHIWSYMCVCLTGDVKGYIFRKTGL